MLDNKKNIMNNYHDYVIKDGEFIGKFDEMYTQCDDPWHQSKQPNRYARNAGIIHIENYKIKSVLECGCGLGYYAQWIYENTGVIPKSVDISENAVVKAQTLFPHLNFEVANISKDLSKYQDVDCIMFAEILWYILPELQAIFQTLRDNFKNKYLIINQVFYKGTQKYGNNYFTNLKELVDYIPFQLLAKLEATTIKETTVETSTIFQIH